MSQLNSVVADQLQTQNPLKEEIENYVIQKNNGGGFYELKDVKYAANVRVDIKMLIKGVYSLDV